MFKTHVLTTKLTNHAHIDSGEVSYGVTFATCMKTGRCIIVANVTVPDKTHMDGIRVFQETIRK